MQKSETRVHAFGRACRLVVDNNGDNGDELLSLCCEELSRLESKFSAYHEDSITSLINQSAGTGAITPLDAEARSLFHYVDALWNESKHQYDPTIRILQDCYDEKGRRRASTEQLQGMLKLVGWRHLEVSDDGAHLAKRGMLIDLNSCVRPYAVDSVRRTLRKNGAINALIELGQDIATIGKQPDGANWMVGTRFPKGARTAIARLKLNNKGYAMRGDYEQAIIQDDERFGRALSPVDGRAIPGLLSVVVIADDCLTACSAASVARLKTEAGAIKWLDNLGFPWMAIDRNLQCHGPLAPAG